MSEAMNRFGGSVTMLGALSVLGVYIGIVVTIAISFKMMTNSQRIDRFLGEGGRNVVTRLMGLLVMAISIQFVINGIKDILPEFAQVLRDSGMLL
jgi:multiple antibiotic resistance protein